MNTVNSFTQANCREVRNALDAALRQVSQQFGIRVSLGRGRFDANEFRMKLTCNTLSDGNFIKTLPVPRVNSTPGAQIVEGTTFNHNGTQFTVIKIHHNRPKYKYIAQNARGTKYKWDELTVRAGM